MSLLRAVDSARHSTFAPPICPPRKSSLCVILAARSTTLTGFSIGAASALAGSSTGGSRRQLHTSDPHRPPSRCHSIGEASQLSESCTGLQTHIAAARAESDARRKVLYHLTTKHCRARARLCDTLRNDPTPAIRRSVAGWSCSTSSSACRRRWKRLAS